MKISKMKFYGGSREKICRLGLSNLFLELQEILISTQVEVTPVKQQNSAGVVRERIDAGFLKSGVGPEQWVKAQTGDVDWIKRMKYNSSIVARLGVEIQVSGRSDALSRDVVHIRNRLQDSSIDVGVIVVPSDALEYFLTDRVANFSKALQFIEQDLKEAQDYPIVLIGIEHDGLADKPLPKKVTNIGKLRRIATDTEIAPGELPKKGEA